MKERQVSTRSVRIRLLNANSHPRCRSHVIRRPWPSSHLTRLISASRVLSMGWLDKLENFTAKDVAQQSGKV